MTSPRSIALSVGVQLVMPLRMPEPTWHLSPSQPPSSILLPMICATDFSVMPGLIARSTSPTTRSVSSPTSLRIAISAAVLIMRESK